MVLKYSKYSIAFDLPYAAGFSCCPITRPERFDPPHGVTAKGPDSLRRRTWHGKTALRSLGEKLGEKLL